MRRSLQATVGTAVVALTVFAIEMSAASALGDTTSTTGNRSLAANFYGDYRLTSEVVISIRPGKSRPTLSMGEWKALPLEALGTDPCAINDLGATISFERDASGSAVALRIERYDEGARAERISTGEDFAGKESHAAGSSPPPISRPEVFDDLAPRLMIAYNVPGVSIVGIENFQIAWRRDYGVRAAGKSERVNPDTVFEAASMSKAWLAYAALKLVEQGKLDLDKSLSDYLDKPYLPDEPRHRLITARMVLSHTTGFPNWRKGGWRSGGPLPILHDPGTTFTYSGEGFLYLQRVIEHITKTPIEKHLRQTLFEPLGITVGSFVWEDRFEKTAAAGHNAKGEIPPSRQLYREANTAYTLYCTPTEYAKFIVEIIKPDRSAPHSLSERSIAAMLTRTSRAWGRRPIIRGGQRSSEPVYWGLSWAIETTASGDRFWHSGSNGTGFRSYCEFDRRRGSGIVIMTNGVGGETLWHKLMAAVGEP